MISDLGLDTVDLNGNGKIDYVMVEGDPENVDAQYRTEYSVKALEDAGLEVNCLSDQVGNWQQDQAQQIVANALGQYGNDVEVVFCNNDAMALGALQAIQSAGRTVGTDIYLVGVDALSEALEDVLAGTMTGTVFNDHFSQSHSAADAAINYLSGAGNEHYIGCDYVKVTKDNAQEILDAMNDTDRATVDQIITNHMSADTMKEASSYITSGDTAGLKQFAKDTLTASELEQIKELYNKYKGQVSMK